MSTDQIKNKLVLNEIIILVSGIFLLALMIPLGAAFDDWVYTTSPHLDFVFRSSNIRRLFDGLFGILLSKFPFLFPWLNHIIVVFTHIVNAILFYKIAMTFFRVKEKTALIFTILFLSGSTSYATICQTDTFNNTLSLMFGLLGIWFYHQEISLLKKVALYLIFCTLSLFAKENGVTFFVIIPFFGMLDCIKKEKTIISWIKESLITYIFAMALFALYYFVLPGSMRSGIFSIKHIITNTILGFGAVYTVADLNALIYNHNVIFFVLTTILSIPILLLAIWKFLKSLHEKSSTWLELLLCVICAFFAILPFTVSSYRSINEMHCYSIGFFALMTFCVLFKECKNRYMTVILATFVTAHAFSASEKYISSAKTAINLNNFLHSYSASVTCKIENPIINVYSLNSNGDDSYSTFAGTVLHSSFYGKALNQVYNWRADIRLHMFYNDKNIKELIPARPTHKYINLPDDEFLIKIKQLAIDSQLSGECDIAIILFTNGKFYMYGN